MHLADTELFIMIYGIVFVKQVTISVRRVRTSKQIFIPQPQERAKPQKHSVYAACGVYGILFSRRGEQMILLFFIISFCPVFCKDGFVLHR